MSEEAPQQERHKILLIEDSLDQAHLIRTFLERQGHDVTMVQDGIRGAALAESRSWSLVVTDLNLPGREGTDLIRRSKSKSPRTPILAITAHTVPHYLESAQQAGADDVAIKPLDPQDLKMRIDRLLAGEEEEAEPTAAGRTVLAIGALPGDVEVGCGGILAKHIASGDSVTIVSLFSGFGAKAQVHEDHARDAARRLGARLYMGAPFREVAPSHHDFLDLIQRTVDETEPDIVYTHSRNENRRSRQNAHHATELALRNEAELYAYQSASSNHDFSPTVFVDISEYLDKKLETLTAYAEETDTRPHLDPDLVRATARYWGRFLGFSRVEPLEMFGKVRDPGRGA